MNEPRPASAARAADELYVGYLPVPPKQRRFLRWAIPGALWVICAASFLWARSQHSPGNAVWDQGTPLKLHGTLVAQPYPIVFVDEGADAPEAVLLVEAGKHGAEHNVRALDSRRVSVSGWPLHRDGRRMLELEPDETAVRIDPASDVSKPPRRIPLGRATLRGEIVDSKCFLGAMKPGEGKTHKECATLCIRGGVPPMFVTTDAEGRTQYVLLTAADGGPLAPEAHSFIADFVEVSGELTEWGGLRVLALDAKNIRRL